jgi:hypothetical protein
MRVLAILTTCIFMIGLSTFPAQALPTAPVSSMIEPSAGTWRTWVLTSGSELRPPAPPEQW